MFSRKQVERSFLFLLRRRGLLRRNLVKTVSDWVCNGPRCRFPLIGFFSLRFLLFSSPANACSLSRLRNSLADVRLLFFFLFFSCFISFEIFYSSVRDWIKILKIDDLRIIIISSRNKGNRIFRRDIFN